MNLIQEIESIKYRYALDLINKDEPYDKKKSVITGEEAFKLCYNRYLLMLQILKPLMDKVGGNYVITDISVTYEAEDDMNIFIKYLKNGRQHILSISCLDYQDIRIVSSDDAVPMDKFGVINKKLILNTFREIINNSLDEEIMLKSTSGKFVVKNNCNSFNIDTFDGKLFSMAKKYSDYEKVGSLLISTKVECNYPKLKELLLDDNNGLALYQHLRIYEEIVPKELIKKIN